MNLGISKRGNVVQRSEKVLNGHVVAIGQSGSGKTRKVENLLFEDGKNGSTIIIINSRNSFNKNDLLPEYRKKYLESAVIYDVMDKGISLPLFSSLGQNENTQSITRRVTNMLKIAADLSRTQEDITFLAVQDVLSRNLYKSEGLAAVTRWLRAQEKAVADNAAGKLRSLCDTNIFGEGDFLSGGNSIYEFNLNKFEYDEQLIIEKFLLDHLLRLACKGFFKEHGVTIFVDEVQNLDFSEGSLMYKLINESRKLNVRMFMATPSILNKKGMTILSQCGTILFFEPLRGERKKMAQMIAPRQYEKWNFALAELKKGECIVCGTLKIKGKDNITVPVELSADDFNEIAKK